MTDYDKGYKHGKRDGRDGVPAKPPAYMSRAFRDGYYDAYDKHERKPKCV